MSEVPESGQSASQRLESARQKWKAAASPSSATQPQGIASFSLSQSVVDGVQSWLAKSLVGRATHLIGPFAEPYVRPLIRYHHRELPLASAAIGAIVSLYPGKTTRALVKVAGPLILSSLLVEIAKAGYRQTQRRD